MIPSFSNNIKRITPVVLNSLYMLMPSLFNQALAFLVIYFSGVSSWGEIVEYQLYYYFVSHIVGWGNKESLLVRFANPDVGVNKVWNESFFSRFVILLIPALAVTLFLFPLHIAFHIIAWISLRFICQSFESLVMYDKRFTAALSAESISLLSLVPVLFYRSSISTTQVLSVLSLSHLLRLLVMLAFYFRFIRPAFQFKAAITLLVQSAPFLLITLSLFFQTKADLYCMSLLDDDAGEVGKYQVLNGFMALIMLVPGFLLAPYLVNIYKMKNDDIIRVQQTISFLGVIISVAFVVVLYVIMEYIYVVLFSTFIYMLVFVYALLPFFYQMHIQRLYRSGDQLRVLVITCAGIFLSIVLCFFLIPYTGIAGALLSSVSAQIFWLILFTATNKKRAAVSGNPSV